MKTVKILAYILILLIAPSLCSCAPNAVRERVPVFFETPQNVLVPLFPEILEKSYQDGGAQVAERTAEFGDGGVFSVFRLGFDSVTEHASEIPLKGKDIQIRWQDFEASPAEWGFAEDLSVPKATLFIETDAESIIISIPALYYEGGEHSTIECLPELEQAAEIEQTRGGYVVRLRFAPQPGTYGEYWYYRRPGKITEWDEEAEALWLRQDLHKTRRFCFDGYYFKTYDSYEPYSENGFFRNAANFTGAQIMAGGNGSVVNMGRAMTMLCLRNQNAYGFWATGPKSAWLSADYGIGYDFYDTRFSTDFARSLVNGYSQFGDAEFLEGAKKYASFLMSYTDAFGYTGGVAGDGVLVPDYWSAELEKRPHMSLNHQLCEINFLLELHAAANVPEYREYAMKMIKGIENTSESWLLPDGNLKYALMYDETSRELTDYPYLTYNDLCDTRELLASIGESSGAVESLIESKKAWMDENGIVAR